MIWLSHLLQWLSMKENYASLHPLLLLICEHKIFSSQLFLSIVLRNNDSYEQIHQEKVAYHYYSYKEERCVKVLDFISLRIILRDYLACSVHNLGPLDRIRYDKKGSYGVWCRIEIHKIVLPMPSLVYAIPFVRYFLFEIFF